MKKININRYQINGIYLFITFFIAVTWSTSPSIVKNSYAQTFEVNTINDVVIL